MIGRDAERALLYDALSLAARGQPQIALVTGDAGIGKTTLVDDLVRRSMDLGFATVSGHCLDIEADISFAPVTEAVRSLLLGVDDLGNRPHGRRMQALLEPDAPSLESVRLLDDLRLTLLEAAAGGRLLLVLEDLHWADRSTQDFAVALARTLRGSILLVLTVRSDALRRRHPLRIPLAEIGRLAVTQRLDLSPLDSKEIAALIAERVGSRLSTAALASVVERSDGNPLFAQELSAADPSAIPDHLSDLLLARVDRLSERGRSLVRIASVDGTLIDSVTLGEVSGTGQDDLDEALPEALDEQVLRQGDGHVQFRHGLIRESVYGDLLPDERTRWHRAFAHALQSTVDAAADPRLSVLSRAAFHWRQAGDLPQALAASVRAGLIARRFGAKEAMTHLEYAMSIWENVPNADETAGHRRPELLVLLAEAAHAETDFAGQLGFVRQAMSLVDADAEPLLASRVYSALARCWYVADDMADESTAVTRAVELAGEQPSEELARALWARAQYDLRADHYQDALGWAERALDVSRKVGCTEVVTLSLQMCAECHLGLGSMTEAVRLHTQAVAVAEEAGLHGLATMQAGMLAGTLLSAGKVDEAFTCARMSFSEGRSRGLSAQAVWSGVWLVEILIMRGDFKESANLVDELAGLGLSHAMVTDLRAKLLLARGLADAAEGLLRDAVEHAPPTKGTSGDTDVEAVIAALCLLGREHEAVEAAHTYLTGLDLSDSPVAHACAAHVGCQVLTAASTTSETSEKLRPLVEHFLLRARESYADEWESSYAGVRLVLAEALTSRLAGLPATPTLRLAVELATPYGAFFALEPRLLLAEELLTHGERDEGRELLAKVWREAHDMGATDHERRAHRLATRSRVPLPHAAAEPGPWDRLTPREREVLNQLAKGATNKQIAEDLIISEKTVSVHVSNILSKLGVDNRGTAAALARDHLG
jgi:DNA-binding CsgD family transcriptional regulator/tetratricopeptide (TPR) repeat protein